MYRLMRQLKKGIEYNNLDVKEKALFDELLKFGILFNSNYKGKKIYKLSNNTCLNYRDNDAQFEVFPNRAIGLFFDYDEIFECVSEGKEKPIGYFMPYSLNPSKDKVENFDLGNTVKVKIIARGYNVSNEGLMAKLPNRELDFFSMDCVPYITIGLAENAKSKNTAKLNFNEEIGSKFLEGKKGLIIEGNVYFNIKDVKEISKVYKLKYVNGEYNFEKIEDKKMYNR